MTTFDCCIIGAGITGLTLALQLQRAGKSVVVIDSATRSGGAIQTVQENGFLYERGPNSLLLKSDEVEQFLKSLQLQDEWLEASPQASKRFLVRNGRMLAMPNSLVSAIRTPLYSLPAKLRILREPFVRKSIAPDESVASFVSRRLGPEFLNYGIAALVSGIFAGDPTQLSVRHAFPKVWNLEHNFGSLIRGSIGVQRQRKKLGQTSYKSRIMSFKSGLSAMTHGIAALLKNPPLCPASITSIQQIGSDWQVQITADQTNDSQFQCNKLVVTIPLHRWTGIPWPDPLAQALRSGIVSPPHPPVTTAFLGYRREDVPHPLDGFGVLIPPIEQAPILGISFNSTLFPNRAPEGHVGMTVFLGGMLNPDTASDNTDRIMQTMQSALTQLLGIRTQPVYFNHTLWPLAIPQYDLQHATLLQRLKSIEITFPGLHLQGNFRGGPGLNDCIASGLTLSKELVTSLDHGH